MNIVVKTIEPEDIPLWDQYVMNHPGSTLYHMSGWKNVIEKTYGQKTFYMMAVNEAVAEDQTLTQPIKFNNSKKAIQSTNNRVLGILPLVHQKHAFGWNGLVSMPYFDLGGILADDQEIEKRLFFKTIELGKKLKTKSIELRHAKPLSWLTESHSVNSINTFTKSHKVRMLLQLPESSEILMKSFKSKLRSQINKPIKDGLHSKIGGIELLADFYKVFTINMRDLGSPVHSKKLIQNVYEQFHNDCKIIIVYHGRNPLACSMVVGFKSVLENPWASSLKRYGRLSPNMLLYWTMLEYACDHGFKYFDFGRSTINEGTYKFKEQWGAQPSNLFWHFIVNNGYSYPDDETSSGIFKIASKIWKYMPLIITKKIGPYVRKRISL
jgi:serine/alanine adding enzyme